MLRKLDPSELSRSEVSEVLQIERPSSRDARFGTFTEWRQIEEHYLDAVFAVNGRCVVTIHSDSASVVCTELAYLE